MSGLKGTGNTLNHQLIISDILYAFMHKIRTTTKYQNYRCLPEIGLAKKVPDIVIFKIVRGSWKPKIIFEISNSKRGFSNDIEKCNELMKTYDTLEEVFIIDISSKKLKLTKIKRGKNGFPLKPLSNQKSDIFNLNVLESVNFFDSKL